MYRTSAAVALLLLTLSGCGTPEWKEFSSTEGRFKIDLPGTPKESIQGEQKSVQSEAFSGVFGVEWIDLPKTEGGENVSTNRRLMTLGKETLTALNAHLLEDRPVTLDEKYPGHEFVADLPAKANLLRLRCFLVEGRLYRVFTMMPSTSPLPLEGGKGSATPEESKFFGSFHMIK